ncbi:hypothetical protein BDQ12DRAFT_396525 [Crucibulum laeve]|uniref:Uncharacterized protein n=1 Tax=Crucibulum laeve TaxID=68775 RepID=A0A5C3M8P2_9AGAR|nr:hypothetical protein BDQ12DRAFT_396525 [Crucibulum laeve]
MIDFCFSNCFDTYSYCLLYHTYSSYLYSLSLSLLLCTLRCPLFAAINTLHFCRHVPIQRFVFSGNCCHSCFLFELFKPDYHLTAASGDTPPSNILAIPHGCGFLPRSHIQFPLVRPLIVSTSHTESCAVTCDDSSYSLHQRTHLKQYASCAFLG